MELNTLTELCKKNNIPYKPFEPMRLHTSFKIGGAADIFITPETKEQLVSVLSCCKEYGIPVFIIGNGSNLLVSDSGIDGAVISLSKMNTVSVNGYLPCGCYAFGGVPCGALIFPYGRRICLRHTGNRRRRALYERRRLRRRNGRHY